MRALIVAMILAAPFASTTTMAQAATSSATAAYTTADTDIGTLLDDPAARAVVDKYIPGFSKGENVDMARSMTLKAIQQFAPDMVTDKALASIDADLAKIAAK
jgi:para-nitrobenzyl esterase